MRKIVIVVFIVLLALTRAGAQENAKENTAKENVKNNTKSLNRDVEITPEQTELAKKRVEAINTDDLKGLKMTILPTDLENINEKTASFYKFLLTKDLSYDIPSDYKVTVTELDPNEPLLMEGLFLYKLRPTHFMTISYKTPDGKGASLIWYILKNEETWYVVLPQPSPYALDRFNERMKAEEEQNAAPAK